MATMTADGLPQETMITEGLAPTTPAYIENLPPIAEQLPLPQVNTPQQPLLMVYLPTYMYRSK